MLCSQYQEPPFLSAPSCTLFIAKYVSDQDVNPLNLPLSCYATTGNCGRTSKCFEAAIHDVALIIHLDLNLHHIATGRGTYKPGTHIRVLFVKGTHVAGVLVVVHHLSNAGVPYLRVLACPNHRGQLEISHYIVFYKER